MEFATIAMLILALAVIWAIIRAILKFTFKAFGCGLLLLLVLGTLAYVLTTYVIN